TVGGFLYGTLGSVAAGMLVSAIRWAVLDTLHHRTGIPQPAWNFTRFSTHAAAFDSLVQDHYRYYQHYGLWGDLHNAYYADLGITRMAKSAASESAEFWPILAQFTLRTSP